jgi:thioredoxin-dependent peroxiredoxin
VLNLGEDAPDFEVSDQSGKTVKLSELRGKAVALFFYPKADTPGCTVEACSFRDGKAGFDAADAVILGISPDTPKAQSKFAEKFGLPYRLLADADHAIAEQYGVWAEKSMYGKKYMGVDRTTFVIGKDGRIAQIFRKVKPENHADEVLAAIKAAG